MLRFDPRFALFAGVLTTVAVAGCASQEGDATPSPTASSSTTTMSFPSDAAVTMDDQDPADPATWVIHGGAVGLVQMGDSYDATLEELSDAWAPVEGCDDVAVWSGGDGISIWFVGGSSGDIETIAVEGALGDPAGGPRTPVGIGLGSTRDEVRAAYPASEEVPAAVGGATYLRQSDGEAADGALFFELAEGEDRVSSLTLTQRDQPPYEPCA
ncbi:hypothetical protein [Microbacterium sp. Marseille-Q6965]|uniref:hypothetical protein n=1 Tax=Microbacterium sp. Marseille-Q6965 TaxID=2965072 RepID=UPI0021B70D10|nr:hypothetical protein [Microbacterium sp. Marseille-Q6965]